jgi:hypothetical protein
MACKHRAVLLVTKTFEGTASNVAKERVELSCDEPAGHSGPHHNHGHDERWEDKGPEVTHILRHEGE